VFNYQFKNYFNHMDDKNGEADFVQLVDFLTLSRSVNGMFKESILDHIYSIFSLVTIYFCCVVLIQVNLNRL
jgi:hypothetical protein